MVKEKKNNFMNGREEALAKAIKEIEKNYGKGAIMDLQGDTSIKVESVSSGSLAIDKALGVGGYPKGRIIEIYGPESSGKTTVALHAIAEVQKQGGVAAFIDAENALDPEYSKALGVDFSTGKFFLSQPDTGEQALDITEKLVQSGAIDIVVIDSVAALVPKTEIEGEIGDAHIGLQARLMSQALRKLTGIINRSNTIAIFINQLREKVGVLYGSPEVTTGGRALKFYSTIRMDIRRSDQIKNGSEVIGNRTKIKIVKNKVAPPFKQAEVDIMYGEGISLVGEMLDIAAEFDIIKKAGAWYSYQGEKLGQGREAAKKVLKDNPELFDEVYEKVRNVFLIDKNKQFEKKEKPIEELSLKTDE